LGADILYRIINRKDAMTQSFRKIETA
jgi:hypothetical protein